jgi:hypothetical protein
VCVCVCVCVRLRLCIEMCISHLYIYIYICAITRTLSSYIRFQADVRLVAPLIGEAMDWVFTALPSLDPLARRNTGNVYLCVC